MWLSSGIAVFHRQAIKCEIYRDMVQWNSCGTANDPLVLYRNSMWIKLEQGGGIACGTALNFRFSSVVRAACSANACQPKARPAALLFFCLAVSACCRTFVSWLKQLQEASILCCLGIHIRGTNAATCRSRHPACALMSLLEPTPIPFITVEESPSGLMATSSNAQERPSEQSCHKAQGRSTKLANFAENGGGSISECDAFARRSRSGGLGLCRSSPYFREKLCSKQRADRVV